MSYIYGLRIMFSLLKHIYYTYVYNKFVLNYVFLKMN